MRKAETAVLIFLAASVTFAGEISVTPPEAFRRTVRIAADEFVKYHRLMTDCDFADVPGCATFSVDTALSPDGYDA